jgi:hypothetical protein
MAMTIVTWEGVALLRMAFVRNKKAVAQFVDEQLTLLSVCF